LPKSITIHPADIRQKSVIKSQEIPVNAYTVDPAQETRRYGTENLVRICTGIWSTFVNLKPCWTKSRKKVPMQESSTITVVQHIFPSDRKPLLSDNAIISYQKILFLDLIAAMEKFWPKVFLPLMY